MALIKCSECGKEMSDKANTCPNCGCPVSDMETSDCCIINGIKYKLTDVINILPKVGNKNTDVHPLYIMRMIKDRTPLSFKSSEELANIIIATKAIPAEFNGAIDIYNTNTPHTPKCPKCNSTSITAGARGVNWTFGLIGASKTVNRCANCGHTWKP